MTRSTMNFALMDPVARALDDLMNQGENQCLQGNIWTDIRADVHALYMLHFVYVHAGFDLDEILRVSGGITSGGGHSPAADIAPTRNADSDYQMNSDDHQDASFAVSIHESESNQSLPSCHHCGIAPKTPQQLLSEMLRCEHHVSIICPVILSCVEYSCHLLLAFALQLCGAVFHTECLRVAHSKGIATHYHYIGFDLLH